MKAIIKGKGQPSDGAIFALGNGGMCAYEDGADVIQLFGPPYSSASFLELRLDGDVQTSSSRLKGSSILTHTIHYDSDKAGEMCDFVCSGEDC